MARVYRAVDTLLQRTVALKILAPQLSNDPEFAHRFEREAITAANLRHPSIITIFDVGEAAGLRYIAMEYIGGATLSTALSEHGAFSLPLAVAVLQPIAEALDAAHRLNAVHRDIKPQNILLDTDGRVLLTDFGIATRAAAGWRTHHPRRIVHGNARIPVTRTGAGAIGHRSERSYALGVVAFELLTGRIPFEGSTPELIMAHAYTVRASDHVGRTTPARGTGRDLRPCSGERPGDTLRQRVGICGSAARRRDTARPTRRDTSDYRGAYATSAIVGGTSDHRDHRHHSGHTATHKSSGRTIDDRGCVRHTPASSTSRPSKMCLDSDNATLANRGCVCSTGEWTTTPTHASDDTFHAAPTHTSAAASTDAFCTAPATDRAAATRTHAHAAQSGISRVATTATCHHADACALLSAGTPFHDFMAAGDGCADRARIARPAGGRNLWSTRHRQHDQWHQWWPWRGVRSRNPNNTGSGSTRLHQSLANHQPLYRQPWLKCRHLRTRRRCQPSRPSLCLLPKKQRQSWCRLSSLCRQRSRPESRRWNRPPNQRSTPEPTPRQPTAVPPTNTPLGRPTAIGDGSTIVFQLDDGIELFDSTGQTEAAIQADAQPIGPAAISPDGTTILFDAVNKRRAPDLPVDEVESHDHTLYAKSGQRLPSSLVTRRYAGGVCRIGGR